jgi:hypothetical protein
MRGTQPDEGSPLTLRVYDFPGQLLFRFTHNWFYDEDAIYVIVFNARRDSDRVVEDWLNWITQRVGTPPIMLISTHADDRTPDIDTRGLMRKYPSICGVYAVDNRSGRGIETVRMSLFSEAARLSQSNQSIPNEWLDVIETLGTDRRPYLTREQFFDLSAQHHISGQDAEELAQFLHRTGRVIYYGIDDRLRDIVIIRPDYIARALDLILEDVDTIKNQGMLEHDRLSAILRHTANGDSYPDEIHPYLLRVMEHLDLAFRVQGENADVVAPLVSTQRPSLPWESDEKPTEPHIRNLCCRFELAWEVRGVIAYLTSRTGMYSIGLHWRSGLFLRNPATTAEALLEQISPQTFSLTVRGPSPQYFYSEIRDAMKSVLGQHWKYLGYRVVIPCSSNDCLASFEWDGLLRLVPLGQYTVRCAGCDKQYNIFDIRAPGICQDQISYSQFSNSKSLVMM